MYRSQAKEAAFMETGIWGTLPLDGLLRRWAEKFPGKQALSDSADRSEWTSGRARNLSFGEVEAEVGRIAALFTTLELTPDTVVAMQMPNTTDAVICCLAAWRAGLIVSLFPSSWRGHELVPALSMCSAKALITTDRIENDEIGLRMRDVAADSFNIRFLFGIGDKLPEGMIDLAALAGEIEIEPVAKAPERIDNAANHVAVITWTLDGSGAPVPVPRSHNHLIAAGLGQTIDAQMTNESRVLSTFGPTGLRGLASTLVPWLVTGGRLACHHFRSLEGFASACAIHRASLLVCPGSLVGSVVRVLSKPQAELPRIGAVWSCDTADIATETPFPTPITDLVFLGEAGVITSLRGSNEDRPGLPVGRRTKGITNQKPELVSLTFGEVDQIGTGETGSQPLEIFAKGPMVPQYNWTDYRTSGTTKSQMAQMYYGMPTGYSGVPTRETGTGTVPLPLQQAQTTASVAGQPLTLPDLDKLYRDSPSVSDAAAVLLPDRITGSRLIAAVVPTAGIPFEPEEFHAYLGKRKIASHKLPHSVIRVSKIPKDDDGEIQRSELAEAAGRKQT